MKRNLLILIAVAIAFCSCSTYRYTSRETYVDHQNIKATPTVVDLRVDYAKRITETSRRCKTPEDALSEAKFNAIVNNKIDVLVDMVYKMEKRLRKYQVTIFGYAGYFRNSRSLYEDIKLLEQVDKEDVEKYIILHDPEALKYINQKGDVVNIYHDEHQTK